MCGIVGIVYRDAARVCDEHLVTTMRDTFPYRGPDDAGTMVDGPVGLGHRRLSIIDLGGGQQPMTDASGALSIVFNGEIYNYRQVRERLIAEGRTFRTQSDTEVILQLYAKYGERCVEFMNGMFAFAIWDRGNRTLFLARDRMGVKPLYYASTPIGLVFASEVKALFASGLVTAECREDALTEYLMFRQVAGNDTLFRGVKSVPPGCTMTVRAGDAQIRRYWSPRPEAPPEPVNFAQALRTFRELFEDAVRLRLISDVPVGTFCSGGVDSSLVTAVAARLKGGPINTYSVGFDETEWDESAYALAVARQCHTNHHQLNVGNVEYSDLFETMVWHNDEPLDFANSVHIFALSKLAKEKVTVVLTGEGSDELFAGYPRYRIPDLARMYRRVPGVLRRMVAGFARDHRLAKLERYANGRADDALLFNSSYLQASALDALFPTLPAFSSPYRQDCLKASNGGRFDNVARLSLLDQESFLVSILHRQDKMSMAASIESRVPFMDYRIVEFANNLPTDCKIRGGVGKAIVKQYARTLLPEEIVDRRKSGFGVPLDRWFRANDGLGDRISSLANDPPAEQFDRATLRRLVDEHRNEVHDHSELLWTVLNLATWRKTFRC